MVLDLSEILSIEVWYVWKKSVLLNMLLVLYTFYQVFIKNLFFCNYNIEQIFSVYWSSPPCSSDRTDILKGIFFQPYSTSLKF